MLKRVFVAINLPIGIKRSLGTAVDKISPLFGREVRFLSADNWHLTIEFLAYQDDHSIGLITKALGKVAAEFTPPPINFERIVYGPPDKPPRMIWLTCGKETSLALGKIKDSLERELFALGVRFRQEHRQFNAHLTLARFDTGSKEELPKLDIAFNGNFPADSIDLMESHLKKSGAQYEVLSKFEFSYEAS